MGTDGHTTTDNNNGDDNNTNDDDQQSTHPHADEQLLIVWMVGAPGPYDDKRDDNNRSTGRVPMTAPAAPQQHNKVHRAPAPNGHHHLPQPHKLLLMV